MREYEIVELKEDEWDYKLLPKEAAEVMSSIISQIKASSLKLPASAELRSNIETTSDPVDPHLMMFHGTHNEKIKNILEHGFRIPAGKPRKKVRRSRVPHSKL